MDLDVRGSPLNEIKFHGYFPGVVGMITEVHAVYYHQHWGFDVTFETQVGEELSEFIREFQEDRDGFWVATKGGRFAGSIVIDGRNVATEGARLRWFIVISDLQGTGIGKALMNRAVKFCEEKGYRRVYLWTFRGLEAARAVYEQHGFRLCVEKDVSQWGQNLKEQMFELSFED
ncbi:MAG: GNAT family N-acetyltransferase [Proteobacteria bacterium]|nr:GNAT family N-acetyltransferase [Pseudomonadota bacterium]